MHIPDGFLDLKICLITYALTIIFWFFAFRKAKETLTDKQIPLMAVLTAMFFAAQMMNYPIIGGTTAHLLGGPILAITLGPYGGLISMSVILLIQALFFGDGGLTTLGANVWNMGIIGVFIPYIVWILLPKNRNRMVLGAFLGAFIGDVLAAISAGLELGFSTKFLYGISISVPVMAVHHSIMGVGEGIVTSIIILILLKSRPDLLNLPKITPKWLTK
ncbi:energy-coupling factor ABC transporter permease [Candidatus Bathyarchaeota archaeon]|nr:energy-coupling factor ABC transporter permease [Candidatus Bathyarchaeota archaeon]